MGILDDVIVGKVYKPRRIMLYGVEGVGKSTWGASATKPIILATEEGLNDIDCTKTPVLTTWQQVVDVLQELIGSQHEYKTVVIDSLDWLEKIIHAKVCEENGVKGSSVEKIGYGRGYKLALEHWHRVLKALDLIRHNGTQIILIAHSRIKRFDDPSGESYDRYEPNLHEAASKMIREWCDEVFFATYETFTRSEDNGFGQTKAKGIGTGERIMWTSERPAHKAKNRLRLPEKMPLIFSEYAKHLNGVKSDG